MVNYQCALTTLTNQLC